jgi:ABC-type Fe3+ transport system substrate-binding protein
MKAKTLGIAGAALALLLTACGSGGDKDSVSAEPQDTRIAEAPVKAEGPIAGVMEQARREGKLVFMNSLTGGVKQIDELRSGFKAYYGFDVDLINRPTANVPSEMSKLVEEFRGGRPASVDVIIGSESHLSSMIQQGASRTIDWSWSPRIGKVVPTWGRGGVVPAFSRIPGITYSTQRVKSGEVPQTLAELATTRHSVATTPYGSSLTHLAQPELWGEARATEFVQKLSKNVKGVIYCGENARILSGEFDIFGPNCGINEVTAQTRKGAPLGYVIPRDAPILAYLYYGVPAHSSHPNMAALWINYMMTPQAQKILWKYEATDYHKLPGSRAAEMIATAERSGLKFVEIDIDFMQRRGAEIGRLRKEFQRILQEK